MKAAWLLGGALGLGVAGALSAQSADAVGVAIDRTLVADETVLIAKLIHPDPVPWNQTYAWFRDGTQVSGSATLMLDSANRNDIGHYSVQLTYVENYTDQSTHTVTGSIDIAGLPDLSAVSPVDPAFHADLHSAPTAIVPLPDDGFIVATGAYIDRHRADGSIDAGFSVPVGALPFTPVRSLILQPDGRLLVVSPTKDYAATYTAVRLNANGSVDPTFQPAPEFAATAGEPALLDDGRWLSIAVHDEDGKRTAEVLRFLADGTLDSTYVPQVLLTASEPTENYEPRTGAAAVVWARDPAGGYFAAVRYGDNLVSFQAATGHSRLFRFDGGGALDHTFTAPEFDPITALRVTSKGLMAQTIASNWARTFSAARTTIFRLNFDGTIDPTYAQITTATTNAGTAAISLPSILTVTALLPDGSTVVCTHGWAGHFGLVRFDPDGTRDRNYAAELGYNATQVTQITVLPSGAVLADGSFQSLGGRKQSYLARVLPNTHALGTRLVNISARAATGGANGPLSVGFVTTGAAARILARGPGPALAQFVIGDALRDPLLVAYTGSVEVGRNDNWSDGSPNIAATASALGAFPFSPGSTDAALLATYAAGIHSIVVAGKNEAPGTALGEVYLADPPPTKPTDPRVVNFSALAETETGERTLVAGFSIAGDTPRNVVIRAIGPSLQPFGIATPLNDPKLTVFAGTTPIAANTDWDVDADLRRYLQEATATVGGFPLPYTDPYHSSGSKDAAIVATLAPGTYSVVVNDAAGGSGSALVEIYEVP